MTLEIATNTVIGTSTNQFTTGLWDMISNTNPTITTTDNTTYTFPSWTGDRANAGNWFTQPIVNYTYTSANTYPFWLQPVDKLSFDNGI